MELSKHFLVLVIVTGFTNVVSIANNKSSDDQAKILWQLSDIALQTQGRQNSFSGSIFPNYYERPVKYPSYSQNSLSYEGYYQNYDFPPQYKPQYLQGEYPPQKYPASKYYSQYPSQKYHHYKYPHPDFLPEKYPYKHQQQPTRESVMDVLFSIAQNDDLQCVPKLVCELTSGTISGRQLGLPGNISPETLLGLLTTFNSAQSSPIVHFGKAAFLGFTSKGNARSCAVAYPNCPSDSDKLLTYLNNHKGGFFRFFQGLMQQPQNYAQHYNKYGPYYYGQNQPYAEKRIITHVPTGGLNNGLFFNDDHSINFPKENIEQTPLLYDALREEAFGDYIRYNRKLIFPDQSEFAPFRTAKKLRDSIGFGETNDNVLDIQRPLPNHVPNPMIFPDRTGTGELKLDYNDVFDSYQKGVSFPNK